MKNEKQKSLMVEISLERESNKWFASKGWLKLKLPNSDKAYYVSIVYEAEVQELSDTLNLHINS